MRTSTHGVAAIVSSIILIAARDFYGAGQHQDFYGAGLPEFDLAKNGQAYNKDPCGDCREIQDGRTDCAYLQEFYVFFHVIDSRGRATSEAHATITWNGKTVTVTKQSILSPTDEACGRPGWGVRVRPTELFANFTPNAGDNSFVVSVWVKMAGDNNWSTAVMKRVVYFLG